jgi:hypothetical protein
MTTPPETHERPLANPSGELVVDLPSPKRPATVGILAFWLAGWGFGLAFMVQQLFSPGPFGLDRVFLLAWMLLWAAAGAGVIGYMAWLVAGRERVLLASNALVIRRGVWGVGWTRRWRLESIHRLRTFGREIPPMIALSLDVAGRGASGVRFESGGQVVRFARTLSEHDARAVVELLRARHSFDGVAPREEPGRHDSHSAA